MQLQRELFEKQSEAAKMHEELEDLKTVSTSEKHIMAEVTFERDRLASLYKEKDMALQVSEISFVVMPLHMILVCYLHYMSNVRNIKL